MMDGNCEEDNDHLKDDDRDYCEVHNGGYSYCNGTGDVQSQN